MSREKQSPYCPPECLFEGVPKMCMTDCLHSRDIVYSNPRTIEMKWAGQWVKAQITGESQGIYYIHSDHGDFSMAKDSPLIR